jgi:hypothetical protein
MRRRDFIKGVANSAAAWPLAARAQQPAMPVIGFIREGSAQSGTRWVGGFQKGLSETGYTGFVSLDFGMGAKWLEILKQIAPGVVRVAVLRDPQTPGEVVSWEPYKQRHRRSGSS